jgi:hypothetical protein
MPAATQRFFIEKSFQRLTRAVVHRAIRDAEAADGEHVAEPFARVGGRRRAMSRYIGEPTSRQVAR